jgi:hypothetical protein
MCFVRNESYYCLNVTTNSRTHESTSPLLRRFFIVAGTAVHAAASGAAAATAVGAECTTIPTSSSSAPSSLSPIPLAILINSCLPFPRLVGSVASLMCGLVAGPSS